MLTSAWHLYKDCENVWPQSATLCPKRCFLIQTLNQPIIPPNMVVSSICFQFSNSRHERQADAVCTCCQLGFLAPSNFFLAFSIKSSHSWRTVNERWQQRSTALVALKETPFAPPNCKQIMISLHISKTMIINKQNYDTLLAFRALMYLLSYSTLTHTQITQSLFVTRTKI